MGGRMTHAMAPVRTWGSPEEQVVRVDGVKALKQAVYNEMELIGCGLHQRRVVTCGAQNVLINFNAQPEIIGIAMCLES